MRMRTVILGMLSGAVIFLLLAQTNFTQTRTAMTSGVNGRWQIVNGTPEMTRNIMLLDTETGNSWIVCTGAGDETKWCIIRKSEGTTGGLDKPTQP
jgi:hypothetical protein